MSKIYYETVRGGRPHFKSFNFKGINILPESAYTDDYYWSKHLGSVCAELGSLYVRLLKLFGSQNVAYFLYKIKDDLFPSALVARAILNKMEHDIRNEQQVK